MVWPADYDSASTYDEMVDRWGQPRTGCHHVVSRLEALGDDLFGRQDAAEAAIRSMGSKIEAKALVAAAGVPVIEKYQQAGETFAMFRVADPDGNVVEFAGTP